MNKKVKNATPTKFNNIQFKSILEKNCYVVLKQANLTVEYESETFVLILGKRVIKPYIHYKSGIPIIEENAKLRDIGWTPDFIVTNEKGNKFVVESKGQINDIFPLKLKIFRHHLDELDYKAIIIVNSKKDCVKAVEYIKTH